MIKAVLYDIAKNSPLSYDNMVSETIYPERTNANYKYFVPYEPIVDPRQDQRYFTYKKVETPKSDAHPLYPLYGQWLIEHVYTRRTNEEIFFHVVNARRLANDSWMDYDLFYIGQGLILKQLNNIVLTPDETTLMLNYVSITNNLIQNLQHEINMKAQIITGQTPNIDEGWIKK